MVSKDKTPIERTAQKWLTSSTTTPLLAFALPSRATSLAASAILAKCQKTTLGKVVKNATMPGVYHSVG